MYTYILLFLVFVFFNDFMPIRSLTHGAKCCPRLGFCDVQRMGSNLLSLSESGARFPVTWSNLDAGIMFHHGLIEMSRGFNMAQ